MKIILSRKGFDSGAGGYPSPFFVKEGRLLSLPIPEENKIYTTDTRRTYSDLRFNDDTTYLDIMNQLGMKDFINKNAHLDPDINQNVLRERKEGWKGLFGQCDIEQQHLCKKCVQPGDLFLFFGWFKDVAKIDGKYKYISGTDKHIIWGYMQVGEIDYISETREYESWKLDHPHYRNRKRMYNTGYIARERLDFNPEIPGSGVFNYDDSLLLTDLNQKNRTVWKLPRFFHPLNGTRMTYHESIFNSANKRVWELYDDHCILHSVFKGQEFVITGNDKVVDWAKSIVLKINQKKHSIIKSESVIRRHDRKITDIGELQAIFDKCDVCRIALCDDNRPYIVPMNFGYEFKNDMVVLYFHCATEGRKLDIISCNNNVCFEIDRMLKLIPGEKSCDWSAEYESIIGNGKISIVEDHSERIKGLTAIMRRYSGTGKHEFDYKIMLKTAVLKITVDSFCGKRHKKL